MKRAGALSRYAKFNLSAPFTSFRSGPRTPRLPVSLPLATLRTCATHSCPAAPFLLSWSFSDRIVFKPARN